MYDETLSFKDCELFYSVRNALIVFARRYLGMSEKLIFDLDDPANFTDTESCETLSQVWQDPSIIDAFVKKSADVLTGRELAIATSWKHALTTHYLVFEHVGKLLFISDNRIFHVMGLVDPLRDLLDYTEPMMVETTLLPFEDKVVYDGFANYLPMQMGPGAQRMVADGIAHALNSGEHIVTGGQLEEVAPVIKEEWLKRDAENMLYDLEMESKAQLQLEGHHEGVLAGLTPDERERAVKEHIRTISPANTFDFADALKKDCTPGPLERDLETLLMREKKMYLQRRCFLLGMPHQQRLTKAQLAEEIACAIGEIDILQAITLQSLSPTQFANLRALFESGGVRRVPAEGLRSFKGLPPVVPMLSYLFFDGDEFIYTIPYEMQDALKHFDWDRTADIVRDFSRAADIADALASLRGIVTMQEAYEEFARCYPDAFGPLDFETGVFDAIEAELIGCDIIETDYETYIVNYTLGDQFREENDIDEDDQESIVLTGDLGSLENILMLREGKVARTLDENMRTSEGLFEQNLQRPAVIALRNYLDAHVPDGSDDYLFADAVIEDLVEFMTLGMVGIEAIETYFKILDDHGLGLDEAHMRKVVDLLMNMSNAIPTWLNNGWAANELHEAYTGKKTFYNEDGSVKKVGRNEPCPCGSGKKYKKCCGR